MGASNRDLRVGLIVVAGLSLGCGLVDDITGPDELGVRHFTASAKDVAKNDVVTLSWEVTGADVVSIDEGIGSVDAKSSQQVRMSRSARFTLTAESGSSSVSATLDVIVDGASVNPPSDPVPEGTPDPDSTPSPTPTPPDVSCGDPTASPVAGCAVLITEYNPLPAGQCLEVTRVTLSGSCPLSAGQQRNIQIEVTALTQNQSVKWGSRGSDELQPSQGTFAGSGFAKLEIEQTVRDSSVTIDFYDADDAPLKSVTIQNN